MTIALVAHTAKGSTGGDTVTSDAIDTSTANFIVLVASTYTGGPNATISDSKMNSYSPLTEYSSFSRCRIYYCLTPTVGGSHTFQADTTGGAPTICVAAFSGVKTASAFDVQNGATGGGVSNLQPGSITPSEDNELLITGYAGISGTPLSIDLSFTISDQVAYSGGNNMLGALAYLIQTSAAAKNPTWTSAPDFNAAAIASFKAGAAPASSGLLLRRRRMAVAA